MKNNSKKNNTRELNLQRVQKSTNLNFIFLSYFFFNLKKRKGKNEQVNHK